MFDDFLDSLGRKLSTLVVRDGEKAHRIRHAAGASDGTAAEILLKLLTSQGEMSRDQLRELFLIHPANEGKKADSVRRAFQRAIESLADDEVIAVTDSLITPLVSL